MDSEATRITKRGRSGGIISFYLRYSGGRRNCRHRLKLPQKQKKSPPK